MSPLPKSKAFLTAECADAKRAERKKEKKKKSLRTQRSLRLNLLFSIILLGSFALVSTASAQTGIRVIASPPPEYKFGETLNFQVSVQSSAPLTGATLFVRAQGEARTLVGEARDDQVAAVIDNLCCGRQRRQQGACVLRGLDGTVGEHEQTVVEILVGALALFGRIGDEMK